MGRTGKEHEFELFLSSSANHLTWGKVSIVLTSKSRFERRKKKKDNNYREY